MGGSSSSEATSKQSSESLISTNIKSGCKYICSNNMRGVKIDASHSKGAKINLDQKCVANANCIMNSTTDTLASVLLKAKTTADAEEKQSTALQSLVDMDESKVTSIQDIRQSIITNITNTCDVKSINNMGDIDIKLRYAVDPDLSLAQFGSADGKCKLTQASTTTSKITGAADTSATAGGKASKGNALIMLAAIGAIVALAGIMASLLRSDKNGGSGKIVDKLLDTLAAAKSK